VQIFGDDYNPLITENPHFRGQVRFADVEFHENQHLCVLLEIDRMPTIHLYRHSQRLEKICDKSSIHTKVLQAIRHYLDEEHSLHEKRVE